MTVQTVEGALTALCAKPVCQIVISKALSKEAAYKKIRLEQRNGGFQVEKYTQTQVFHENISEEQLKDVLLMLIPGCFGQVNGKCENGDTMDILISKKGKVTTSVRKGQSPAVVRENHDRTKRYLLPEGTVIPPLVDMGVFTQEGKVVRSMYDKYRQINRFVELIDDACKDLPGDTVRMIDFGCGKSYLTFIVYYYFTAIRKKRVEMIGLDLKEEVIEKCNQAAKKYGYQGLSFQMGDINGYKCPFDVDIVMTLHACDTATDYALFNAVRWNAKMIFSVPCCQHELNHQIQTRDLRILTRYGILQDRFCALLTDAVRANLLEYCGYRTQVLEFVDLSHTPKNVLLRAVRRPVTPKKVREDALREAEQAMEQFHVNPTLYRLLVENAEEQP